MATLHSIEFRVKGSYENRKKFHEIAMNENNILWVNSQPDLINESKELSSGDDGVDKYYTSAKICADLGALGYDGYCVSFDLETYEKDGKAQENSLLLQIVSELDLKCEVWAACFEREEVETVCYDNGEDEEPSHYTHEEIGFPNSEEYEGENGDLGDYSDVIWDIAYDYNDFTF